MGSSTLRNVDHSGYNKREAFDSPESHFHTYYELYYLISGRRRYVVENDVYDLSPGDAVLIPPLVMHKTVRPPGVPPNESHERFLFVVAEIPEPLQQKLTACCFRLSAHDKEFMKPLIEECREALTHRGPLTPLTVETNARQLLLCCARAAVPRPDARLSDRSRTANSAALYVRENCARPLTLDGVAKLFSFSREYFSALFKAGMGQGFSEYLTSSRIALALDKLAATDKPIRTVSEECGFNDSNYFATVFRKHVGITPGEYRKRCRENLPEERRPL